MIKNIYFSGAYNYEPICLKAYHDLGVDEIRLAISKNSVFGTGQDMATLALDRVGYDEIGSHFEQARRAGLKINFLFQPVCTGNQEFTGKGIREIVQIARLINRFKVDYITLSQPFLTNTFRRLCPDAGIKISSLFDCDNMGKFELLLEYLNVDIVVVSPFANKNFRLLRQAVKRWGAHRLEIVCSDVCIMGCPYRTWHSRFLAHDNILSNEDYLPRVSPCAADILHRKHVAMSAMFIRNRDLEYYQKIGINRFHIGKPYHASEDNINCAKYYGGQMEPEFVPLSFFREFPLFSRIDLSAMDGYYDKFFNEQCDGTFYNCCACDHCRNYADKVFEYNPMAAQTGVPEPKKFFRSLFFSRYINQVEKLGDSKPPGAESTPDPASAFQPDAPRAHWDKKFTTADWLQIAPPWRPCEQEINVFDSLIRTMPPDPLNQRAAVLGSTPEIRNILADISVPVDVIDFSEVMYELTSRLCPKRDNESFQFSDWISFFRHQESQTYDIIIGDLILRLLPDKKIDELMKYVARTLKKDGRLILRLHVSGKPEDIESRSRKLLDWAAQTNIPSEEVKEILFFHLSEHLVKSDHLVDMEGLQKYFEILSKKSGNIRMTKILKWAVGSFQLYPQAIYVRTQKEIDGLMAPFFKKEAEHPCQRECYPNVAISVFRK